MTRLATGTDPHPLDEAARAALTDLVVRGMRRGSAPELDSLVSAGLALAKGPVTMPTVGGRELVGTWSRLPAGSPAQDRVTVLYHAFLPVNRRLRELCTAWQCRPDGSPNDHTDAAYDASVRDRFDDVHTSIARIIRRLADPVSGLAHYRDDLAAALDAFDAGDTSALTSPLGDSYHTVWMRLHQELLLLLGVSRAQDEALEEQLVSETAG
ncbi:hypothetical protein [Frankia sp. Cppng1_Ct_nod]|uniref:hypothetical protein n=1 Tax=Frankia sp. Cppng1_Ct_nod TaxID=2897162 RepID=UPI0010410950|nr:hypothetical protein [Frankia sp. Cppng1_Ct_nod]